MNYHFDINNFCLEHGNPRIFNLASPRRCIVAVLIVLCNSVLSQEKITYMLTIVKKVRLISDCAPVCSVHLSVSITQVEIIHTSTEKMANERIFC